MSSALRGGARPSPSLSLVRAALSSVSLTPDTKQFLSDRFDVHDYANAVLQGKAYDPDAGRPRSGSTAKEGDAGPSRRQEEKGDLGLEVARLNYGIVSGRGQLERLGRS